MANDHHTNAMALILFREVTLFCTEQCLSSVCLLSVRCDQIFHLVTQSSLLVKVISANASVRSLESCGAFNGLSNNWLQGPLGSTKHVARKMTFMCLSFITCPPSFCVRVMAVQTCMPA